MTMVWQCNGCGTETESQRSIGGNRHGGCDENGIWLAKGPDRDDCEKSQTADGDTPQESPNRVGDLEPVAYMSGDGTLGGGALDLHWPEEIDGRTYQELPEPLLRKQQFFERVEYHRERACYCNGGDGVNEPECHVCAFARNLREDFTQKGDNQQ